MKKKKYHLYIFSMILFLGICHESIRPAWPQTLQYTVKKGDTLWDICEEVYGNSELWPKLWEMNPFITNPHLLKPGDVIRLLENVPLLKTTPSRDHKVAIKPSAPAPTPSHRYDISGFAHMENAGFLSNSEITPLGMIVSGEGERMMFGKGEVIYVKLNSAAPVQTGEQFIVVKVSHLLADPVTREDLGYTVSVLGRVRIVQTVSEGFYKGVIVRAFRTIRNGDSLLAYRPVASCIEFSASGNPLATHISAHDAHKVMIGQYSIVYIPKGFLQGVRQGQVFEILRNRAVEFSQKHSRSREVARLPDYVLGYCLVLETTADTSTAVVLSAKEPIPNGAPMKRWASSEPPRALLSIPPCRTE